MTRITPSRSCGAFQSSKSYLVFKSLNRSWANWKIIFANQWKCCVFPETIMVENTQFKCMLVPHTRKSARTEMIKLLVFQTSQNWNDVFHRNYQPLQCESQCFLHMCEEMGNFFGEMFAVNKRPYFREVFNAFAIFAESLWMLLFFRTVWMLRMKLQQFEWTFDSIYASRQYLNHKHRWNLLVKSQFVLSWEYSIKLLNLHNCRDNEVH